LHNERSDRDFVFRERRFRLLQGEPHKLAVGRQVVELVAVHMKILRYNRYVRHKSREGWTAAAAGV
jgi:hypothetical protein